ncbi:MAG: hypothetical protein RLZZ416_808 [Candidatus Parcubacteria bacterium]|jgi:hypothetical protein
MAFRRAIFALLSAAFAAGLVTFLFFRNMADRLVAPPQLKTTSNNKCSDPQIAAEAKVNPNKLLFISCGGFLD